MWGRIDLWIGRFLIYTCISEKRSHFIGYNFQDTQGLE